MILMKQHDTLSTWLVAIGALMPSSLANTFKMDHIEKEFMAYCYKHAHKIIKNLFKMCYNV